VFCEDRLHRAVFGFRRSTLPSIVIVALSVRLSTHDETAVHRNGLAGYVACGITAKPQNSIRNLLGTANPAIGMLFSIVLRASP
jgi:hypothetical protein